MEKIFIGVRGVDAELFRKFRARAIEDRIKLSEALSKALANWLEENEEKKAKGETRNLLKMKPIKVGRKVRWSEEIDEILYGFKK